ncbi:hypothetical protein GCM10027047_22790 [Rhodococcus aerolatus]
MSDDTGLTLPPDAAEAAAADHPADQTAARDAGVHQRALREWLLERTASPSLGAPVSLLVGGALVTGVAVHPTTAARLAARHQSGGESGAERFESLADEQDLALVDAEPAELDTVHLANARTAGTTLAVLSVAVSRVDGWSPVAEADLEGIWDTHHVE